MCLSVVQMLDGVVRLVGCELLAAVAGELVTDGLGGHIHGLLVVLCLGKGIRLIVRLQMVHSILGCLRRELLTVFAGELLVDAPLAHVHHA